MDVKSTGSSQLRSIFAESLHPSEATLQVGPPTSPDAVSEKLAKVSSDGYIKAPPNERDPRNGGVGNAIPANPLQKPQPKPSQKFLDLQKTLQDPMGDPRKKLEDANFVATRKPGPSKDLACEFLRIYNMSPAELAKEGVFKHGTEANLYHPRFGKLWDGERISKLTVEEASSLGIDPKHTVDHWERQADFLGQRVNEATDDQTKIQISYAQGAITSKLPRTRQLGEPLDIQKLSRELDKGLQAAKVDQQKLSDEAERNGKMYGAAAATAAVVRDGGHNIVSKAADLHPALKPLSIALDAALAGIDSAGKGDNLAVIAAKMVLNGLAAAVDLGDSKMQKAGEALAKASLQIVAEYSDPKTLKNVSKEQFARIFAEKMGAQLIGLCGDSAGAKLLENKNAQAALTVLAGTLYDQLVQNVGKS